MHSMSSDRAHPADERRKDATQRSKYVQGTKKDPRYRAGVGRQTRRKTGGCRVNVPSLYRPRRVGKPSAIESTATCYDVCIGGVNRNFPRLPSNRRTVMPRKKTGARRRRHSLHGESVSAALAQPPKRCFMRWRNASMRAMRFERASLMTATCCALNVPYSCNS